MSAFIAVEINDHMPTDVAVTLFAIQSCVSIDGREPSLDDAKHLYSRWFGTDPDGGQQVARR